MVNYNFGNTDKFRRGQIWWVLKDKEEEKRKSEDPEYFLTTKSRPWLIVSVDILSGTSGVVTAIPVCTDHSSRIAHSNNVKLLVNGRNMYAKCTEPMSFNWKDINGEYVATVCPKVMDKIADEISRYLGKREPSLKELEMMIQAKINQINNERNSENNQVNDILDKMNDLLNIAGTNIHLSSQVVMSNNDNGTIVSGKEDNPKKQYRSWTIESKKDFCNLYKTNKDELLKKYNVSNKTAINYYYKFKKELDNK